MGTFFDKDADSSLVHSSVRTHSEIENVANAVEDDILREYTVGTVASSRTVYLDGYNDTTPASSDAALKDALKRTIADVLSWRLQHYDDDPTASMIVRGSRTVARATSALDPNYPDAWDHRLIPFDLRDPLWGV